MEFKLEIIKKRKIFKISLIFISLIFPILYTLKYFSHDINKEIIDGVLLSLIIIFFFTLFPLSISKLKYKKTGTLILTDSYIKINRDYYDFKIIDLVEIKIKGIESDNDFEKSGTDNFILIIIKGKEKNIRFHLLLKYQIFVINDLVGKWQKKYPQTKVICNTKKNPQKRALKYIFRSFFTSSKE